MLQLSIIIVNWNSWEYLAECVKSILESITTIKDFEILIIDNNSKEDKSSLIINISEKIKFFNSNQNLGFPRANNFLIEKSRGKYIALVNPDVIIKEKDVFESLIGFMESNKNIGIIGPKVIDGKGRIVKSCARKFPNICNTIAGYWYLSSVISKIPFLEKKCSFYYNDYNLSKYVDTVHGGFMIIKREVVDKIGGLDESQMMYLEDIEYPYRALINGYKTYYMADKTIIHLTNKSSDKAPKDWIRRMAFTTYINFFKIKYSIKYVLLYHVIFLVFFLVLFPFYVILAPFLYLFTNQKKFIYNFYLKLKDIWFLISDIKKNTKNEFC